MVAISVPGTFRMAMKAPVRRDASTNLEYQDWSLRDYAANCRLRRWDVTYSFTTKRWTVVKYWTTQLPGEIHYIRAPKQLADAILMHLRTKYQIDHLLADGVRT